MAPIVAISAIRLAEASECPIMDLRELIGIVQAVFVLTMLLPILPALHPRMANEQYGPTVVRQLEPPGFLGLHYGIRTPISILIAHAIFGVILGAFYVVK